VGTTGRVRRGQSRQALLGLEDQIIGWMKKVVVRPLFRRDLREVGHGGVGIALRDGNRCVRESGVCDKGESPAFGGVEHINRGVELNG
jgi:hypothetical protein